MSGTNVSQSGDRMPEVLLDSDILIDHLRGYESARQYLKCFEAGEIQGYLSVITVAELAAGQLRQAQEEKIHQLLALFTPLALDFTMAWHGRVTCRETVRPISEAYWGSTGSVARRNSASPPISALPKYRIAGL
jgi:hypothetical protein